MLSKDKAILCARTCCDKKAIDVVIMDMRKVSSIADYFIIGSGTSGRHIKAVANGIEEKLEQQGRKLRHKEGYTESQWILLDYGDCIVHIFNTPTRKFYDLERLWGDAPRVSF